MTANSKEENLSHNYVQEFGLWGTTVTGGIENDKTTSLDGKDDLTLILHKIQKILKTLVKI